MAAIGTFYALSDPVGRQLLDLPDAPAVAYFLYDLYAELDTVGWVQTTDKAWDAIHRALTGGKLEHGRDVAHSCVLGSGDFRWKCAEWIINVLNTDEVRDASNFLRGISEADLWRGYEGMDPNSYYFLVKSPEDFEYTWHYFVLVREFFLRASEAGLWVVFLADQ